MRTAVSIPDDVYDVADRIARRMNLSRSQFYSKVLTEYIESYFPESISEKLNRVYGENPEDSKLDPMLYSAQLNILEKEEWK